MRGRTAVQTIVALLSASTLACSLSSAAQPIPTGRSQPLTPIPGLGSDSTQVSDQDGMTLVYVPAGEFTMGSDDSHGNRKPAHKVMLDAFWIDRTDVTNAMFTKFADATSYQTDAEEAGSAWVFNRSSQTPADTEGANWRHPQGPMSNLDGLQSHPVVDVSWNDATSYCAWAGRRLPTEAEWEKAARGTDRRVYPWGDTEPDAALLNFNYNVGHTSEVGKYPGGASPYGALDMAGNVWQWVNDWYDENYYSSSPAQNPPGPSSGQYRSQRGGAWGNNAFDVRATSRSWVGPTYRGNSVGFRCATSP